ncbi:MAG: lamin tail domain-containing protein [Bacteroidales bacterium]|nr:lamin tail domain-containing protein [Bacteroidales bacterium]
MRNLFTFLKVFTLLIALSAAMPTIMAQNAWINELHYDNSGGDVNEFIEVVIENPGSYALSDFSVDLYNGSNGTTYNTKTLDVFTVGSTIGNFTFYTYVYPVNGIQNGAPDGLSLSYQTVLIPGQFLSYEGTLVATNGPAIGLTSTDIGVSEGGAGPGESLQLGGGGTMYSDFTWQNSSAETPGLENNNQSIGGVAPPVPVAIYYEPFDADLGQTTTSSVIGAQVWGYAAFGNPAGCSAMSGYDGGPMDNEDWLVTNAINCTNYTNVTLNFDHAVNYADNSGLSVLISTDYDGVGDPNNFTWTDLTSLCTFPATPSWSFIDGGTVDINALVGSSTYIAFKYVSVTTADAATWEVDNITVAGDFSLQINIAGSFNGWNAADPDYAMTLNANGLAELTHSLDAGTNEYKVVEDGNWFPGDNQVITLAATTDITWKYNFEANLVSHTLPVVAGDFVSELGGTDWEPTDLIGEMSDPEGDDIYTLELLIPAGNYEAKVTLNQNWNQSTGGNVPFATDGITPTVFTYDFPNNTTTISGPPPPTDLVTFIVDDAAGMNYDGFALKGSWDANGQYDPSWGGGAEHTAFYDDGTNGDAVAGDHIWTCQQELVVDGGTNAWEWGVNDTESNWIAGNWGFTVPDQTPQTLSWTVPATPALVINEIMYNSPGSDEEWVELYNNTDQPISLENWKLLDNDAAHTPITIPAGYTIGAYGYFTIEVATSGAFPFTPDYDGSGNFNFTNTTDVVRLYNANGILIDIVSFGDSDPWPSSPDGYGPSLSLFHPDLDNALPESWRGSNEDGGTPGTINFPINIVTPNGGETIDQGSSYDITWTVEGWDGNVDINLVREGQNPVLLVSNLAVSNQSFTWNVFTTVEPATDYKIMISETTGGNPFDMSDDFFTVNEVIEMPEIVITEIMYNPPESGNDSLEFIELYNNGVDAVDLEGFYFSKGVDYTFPAMTLLPDSYQVIGINSAAMLSTFGVVAEQWTSGALSNSGEEIELSDSFGNIVDNVLFSDALPWDTLADGHGPSLTLCNPNTDNSIAENWTHSIHYVGVNAAGDSIWATPGMGCDNSILVDFEGTPTTVGMGGSVMFTDLSFGDVTQWTWTFDGGTPNTWDGQTPPEIMYDAEGSYDVTLSITDGVNVEELTKMDYITVMDLPVPTNLLAEVGPFDDVTLTWNGTVSEGFSDDFESYEDFVIDFAPWVNLDVDGSTTYGITNTDWPNAFSEQSFIIFNPSQTVPAIDDIIPHSGDKLAACFAATSPPNNDWLITPEVNIANGFMLKFWAKSYTDQYGLERFKVGVSTTGLNPGDFTIISEGAYVEAPVADWTEFTYDLSAYAGQNVYVGIQCVSNDAFILLVDDFTIGATKSTIAYNPTQPINGKATKSIGFTTQPNSQPAATVKSLRGIAAELLGFNVYRDDVQINAALVTETTYNDPMPAIGTHDYYVTSVYTEGESGPSNVVTILITGISDHQSESVTVYPNPTDGLFTINMPGMAGTTIMVTDITGKVVYNEFAVSGAEINLTGLEKGLYFVRIQDQMSKQSLVKKLLVY